jgi:hypothetical protein
VRSATAPMGPVILERLQPASRPVINTNRGYVLIEMPRFIPEFTTGKEGEGGIAT